MDKSRLLEIAKQYLIFDHGQGETQLVRRIQQARGERACFATADARACEQMNCPWRTDCLQKLTEFS
jgi:type I site-specific restriction-modification system R (restriction) subunit